MSVSKVFSPGISEFIVIEGIDLTEIKNFSEQLKEAEAEAKAALEAQSPDVPQETVAEMEKSVEREIAFEDLNTSKSELTPLIHNSTEDNSTKLEHSLSEDVKAEAIPDGDEEMVEITPSQPKEKLCFPDDASKDNSVRKLFSNNQEVSIDLTDSSDSENDSDMDLRSGPKSPQIKLKLNQMSNSTKIALPGFKKIDNIKTWIKQCSFILYYGGIDDEAKQVSHMCGRLPQPLQKTVILELSKGDDKDKTKMTVKHFEATLEKCCRKDNFEYEIMLKR
ncbi:Oidioi.mRNA.OKI2018_I69.YSR.g17132.t1.cds [Oikopleura dioica]|uniref:Oidioi.mRNA.OKI2018_I69.YSR.g17132.t1.cds n=1 Tax=Oikopleura dioica TaxID=34765 RepID=A0ABN7SI98_OIKDI|nr:Oidioi.mRNA.OKI2018_I69.YSR.g17132.t1.cds [Oikopleura dioica]